MPAFVFFFQLLYPFAWVNDPLRATAAAAGGTILIRTRALRADRRGAAVRGALIDDVALAAAVKRGGRDLAGPCRPGAFGAPYPTAADIWRMVARTAYVQLRFSPLLLLATTLGDDSDISGAARMPRCSVMALRVGSAGWPGAHGGCVSADLAPVRPVRPLGAVAAAVAAFYMAATIGSAVNHHLGRGVAWKGRAYQGAGA